MSKIKYICDKCGHIEYKSTIGAIFSDVVVPFVTVFGIAFIVFLVYIGPGALINMFVSGQLSVYGSLHSNDLRHEVLNYTTYDGQEAFEFAEDLFKNLPRVRYVSANVNSLIQAPNETYTYGGDCKNSAIMFTSMMQSAGHQAFVYCNVGANHCVTYIPENEGAISFSNRYMIVDLTTDDLFIYTKPNDYWKDWKQYDYRVKLNKPRK